MRRLRLDSNSRGSKSPPTISATSNLSFHTWNVGYLVTPTLFFSPPGPAFPSLYSRTRPSTFTKMASSTSFLASFLNLGSRKKHTRHQLAYQSTTTTFPTNLALVRTDSNSSSVLISITGGGCCCSFISSSDGKNPHIILGAVCCCFFAGTGRRTKFFLAKPAEGHVVDIPSCFRATKLGAGALKKKAAVCAEASTKMKRAAFIAMFD
mmetsp:Transcript_46357/g.94819  ORF Transcript_46357/g.94819 Transcript_46357/m.94819 type:complete len:208 (-) Transcript_46357:77-700(-)